VSALTIAGSDQVPSGRWYATVSERTYQRALAIEGLAVSMKTVAPLVMLCKVRPRADIPGQRWTVSSIGLGVNHPARSGVTTAVAMERDEGLRFRRTFGRRPPLCCDQKCDRDAMQSVRRFASTCNGLACSQTMRR
jgi:hypothetical protein